MYRLSLVILLWLINVSAYAQTQSPHGEQLQISCSDCHNPGGWSVDSKNIKFDHESTKFILEGQHQATDCIDCHGTLVFEDASTDCISCHTDVHSMTVGNDCARCHVPDNWLVDNIPELHERNGFVLTGVHSTVSCEACHTTEPYLVFNPIGNECMSCHSQDYQNAKNPDHVSANYSTDCLKCHDLFGLGWNTELVDHSFFPLTLAHNIQDCNECHTGGDFSNISADCFVCHESDYNASVNPDHQQLNFSNDCAACHTTDPDWVPATFDVHNDYYPLNGAHALIATECLTCHPGGNYSNTPNTCAGCHQEQYDNTNNPNHMAAGFPTDCIQCHSESAWTPATFDHDSQFFPIYSGKHEGEWTDCIDCHTNPDNFAVFTCISCHTNPETDEDHAGISGYIYEDNACFGCHPTGDAEDGFNHDLTNFPLTGAHIGIDCAVCHSDGFQGTPTDCNACHNDNYNETANPNHNAIGISTDCIQCHTTDPGWIPASFANHNDYYQLNGAHAQIANQCTDCHNGDYNNTPNTCVACHQSEYDNTNNPNHQAANFPTDCIQCHTENAWTPATFDHDGQFFPIYSGKHKDEWSDCIDCHTNPDNFAVFTCITCHTQGETADDHDEVTDYVWESNACLACHPDGTGGDKKMGIEIIKRSN